MILLTLSLGVGAALSTFGSLLPFAPQEKSPQQVASVDLALPPLAVGLPLDGRMRAQQAGMKAQATAASSARLGGEFLGGSSRGTDGKDLSGARSWQEPQAQGKGSYIHLSSTDVADPASFWWTDRENMVGEHIEPEWDPLKLINTDRPDFTDVATVVGDGVVQIESGYLRWRRTDDEIRRVTETLPNVLLRVGHGHRFEYRVKWRGYLRNDIEDRPSGISAVEDGAADLELGFKYVVAEQDDLFPMQTIVTRVNVPVGSSDVSADRAEPGASYIINWQARRWWFFRINTGVDFFNQPSYSFVRGLGGAPVVPVQVEVNHDDWVEFSQSFSSYMQISKRIGMFAEWFAFMRHGSEDDHVDHFHNYGLYVYATPNSQFDLRVGWRLGDHVDEAFSGGGYSIRF